MRRSGAEWVLPVAFAACLLIAGIGWAVRGLSRAVAAEPLTAAALTALLAAVVIAVKIANKREAKRRAVK